MLSSLLCYHLCCVVIFAVLSSLHVRKLPSLCTSSGHVRVPSDICWRTAASIRVYFCHCCFAIASGSVLSMHACQLACAIACFCDLHGSNYKARCCVGSCQLSPIPSNDSCKHSYVLYPNINTHHSKIGQSLASSCSRGAAETEARQMFILQAIL